MIFLLKTNMIEAKAYYRFQYPDNQICDICEKQEETTQHLFECEGYKEIRKNIRIKSTPMETIKENDMNNLAHVMFKILEKRKELMEEKKSAPILDTRYCFLYSILSFCLYGQHGYPC